MTMHLAAYLVLSISGIAALLRGLFVTRLTWRDDIEPFSRRSRTLDIALHPERCAKPQRLREIRGFFGLGALLVRAAVAVVLYDVYLAMAAA